MRMTKLLERETPRTQPHTAICPVCGDGFARGRHSNRHKAAGRQTVAWSTYCSRACRQVAYRMRKDIHNNVPASARRRRPVKRRLPLLSACVTSAPERLSGSYPHTCVTRPEISQRVQWPATPKKKSLPPEIVPDGKWPGMYRLRLSNGEPFASVILCTADRKKVDKRTRSKWSRMLRYAAEYKTNAEPLATFVRRKGGINECAARFARCLG